jgi:hypothetical protein
VRSDGSPVAAPLAAGLGVFGSAGRVVASSSQLPTEPAPRRTPRRRPMIVCRRGGCWRCLSSSSAPRAWCNPSCCSRCSRTHTHTHSEREGGGGGGTERDTANKPLGCQSVSAAAHRLPVHTRWGAGALGRWGRRQRTSSVQPPPRPRAEAEQAADGHDASLLGNVRPLDRDGAPPPAVVAAAPRRTRTTPISPTRSTDSASGCSASCHAGRAQRATDDPPPCVHGWRQTPHNTDSKRRVSHVQTSATAGRGPTLGMSACVRTCYKINATYRQHRR